MDPLADHDHPSVRATAWRLTEGLTEGPHERAVSERDKLARLFAFVRDDILFGFPPGGDLMRASETLALGYGQCNTKATLLLALCKACAIPARIHFALIDKRIQRGFFVGPGYRLLPPELSHGWIEVRIDGRWRRIDSFINDLALYRAARRELARRGWQTGFSLALGGGETSPELNLDHEVFQQMAAVTGDHGTWDDPGEYYRSPGYRNRPGPLKRLAYRLMIGAVNARVRRLRAREADTG